MTNHAKLARSAQFASAAPAQGRQWMRIPTFARYVDCSQRLVERLVHDRVIPVARLGRSVRIDVAAAEAVLLAQGLPR
jgi:excisionase family DNA binding protein